MLAWDSAVQDFGSRVSVLWVNLNADPQYIKAIPPPCSSNNTIPLLSSSKHTHTHTYTPCRVSQSSPHPDLPNTTMTSWKHFIWVSSFLLRLNECDLRPGRREICMAFAHTHWWFYYWKGVLLMVLSLFQLYIDWEPMESIPSSAEWSNAVLEGYSSMHSNRQPVSCLKFMFFRQSRKQCMF